MTLYDLLPHDEDTSSDNLLGRFLDYVAGRGLTLYPAQEEAVLELFEEKNVILNTPTGSGKSLVAAALHFKGLAQGKRSVYTCPIKALVNEKWLALCREFGPENVGLSTGDAREPSRPVGSRCQVPRQVSQEPMVPFRRNGADAAHDGGERNRLQKAQTDQGWLGQPAQGEVGGVCGDFLVKSCHPLVKLRADAANQPVSKAGQLAQRHRRAWFDLAIDLCQRNENHRAFLHGR
jgi:hypothetical protein